MPEFKLSIDLDNAAFEDGDELADILSKLSNFVRGVTSSLGNYSGKVRDSNGNTVGNWSIR